MSEVLAGGGSRWVGTDSEGSTWDMEIEADAFNTTDGLVVSIWVENGDLARREATLDTLVTATPQQAREMAAVLLRVADHVEQRRNEG